MSHEHLNSVLVLNPNGIPSLSPGLRAGRYPGSTSQTRPNPESVASHPRRALAQRFNPFRVDDSSSRPPRVARASQPWAEGCNPFGIGAPFNAKAQRRRVAENGEALLVPSPLNGERVRVRGGKAERVRQCESRGQHHPSPSFPLPVEGRGRSASERRFPNRRAGLPGARPLGRFTALMSGALETSLRCLQVRTVKRPEGRAPSRHAES